MSRFDLRYDWREPSSDEDLYGPECTTFADLGIWMGGGCLTSNRRTDSVSAGTGRSVVTGPLSGLADWIVENWLYVFWDIHTPFSKASADGMRVPTLKDVQAGNLHEVNYSSFAEWYHRHTFGHGCSDLALPTITFLPEDKVVGIAVSEPPELDATTSFSLVGPKEPVWISKDDVALSLKAFVEDVIQRAHSTNSTRHWAEWLRKKLSAAIDQSRNDDERRRLMFGSLVAESWLPTSVRLGGELPLLAGVLVDSELVREESTLRLLEEAVEKTAGSPPMGDAWRGIRPEPGERMLPPFERGYRQATRARAALGVDSEPIDDLRGALEQLGIALDRFNGPPLFRSASMVASNGAARVYLCTSDARFTGVAPTRFSIAAALGRLLSEGSSVGVFGSAHSQQSRWQKTQEANAFAAEFLLPLEAISEGGDVAHLAEKFGISRVAAEYHVANRSRRIE